MPKAGFRRTARPSFEQPTATALGPSQARIPPGSPGDSGLLSGRRWRVLEPQSTASRVLGCLSRGGWSRRCGSRALYLGDGSQNLSAVAEQNADVLEVLIRQMGIE